jgi:hypothetical protein
LLSRVLDSAAEAGAALGLGRLLLKFDERPRQARAGAIEEEPHALRLSTLNFDQVHLPADVVDFSEVGDECLIDFRISFEPSDSAFDALAEAGTDFETFMHSAIEDHGGLSSIFEMRRSYGAGTIRARLPIICTQVMVCPEMRQRRKTAISF